MAYATEDILLVLILAGTPALSYSLPIGVAIVALLAIVVVAPTARRSAPIPRAAAPTSWPRTTSATCPALVAAAALLIDYVLTVAVSVGGRRRRRHLGVPRLLPYRVWLCVLAFVA